jgi:hypothetical protein
MPGDSPIPENGENGDEVCVKQSCIIPTKTDKHFLWAASRGEP